MTPRSLFDGTNKVFGIEVVYKDRERARVEVEAKRPVGDEYLQFEGTGYLLSEIEQPHLVIKKDGCESYIKYLDQAILLYDIEEVWGQGLAYVNRWLKQTKNKNRIHS